MHPRYHHPCLPLSPNCTNKLGMEVSHQASQHAFVSKDNWMVEPKLHGTITQYSLPARNISLAWKIIILEIWALFLKKNKIKGIFSYSSQMPGNWMP